MSPFKSTLYWRVLISFCAANLLALGLGIFFTQSFIEFSTAVEINWVALAQGADQAYESGGSAALTDWSRQQRREGIIDATLYENGQALAPIRLSPAVQESLQTWLEEKRDVVLQPWPNLYLAVQQVQGSDGQVRQLVALSRTHSRLRQGTRQTIFLAIQGGFSLLFIGLVGWWVARSVAKPVEAISRATRRMAAGELSARVEAPGAVRRRSSTNSPTISTPWLYASRRWSPMTVVCCRISPTSCVHRSRACI